MESLRYIGVTIRMMKYATIRLIMSDFRNIATKGGSCAWPPLIFIAILRARITIAKVITGV